MFDSKGSFDLNAAKNHQKKISGRSDKGITDLYLDVIREVPPGETLVEVGALYGSSFFWLVMHSIDSGKDLNLYAVDHFKGSEGPNDKLYLHADIKSGRQREVFDRNMSPLDGYYHVIEGDSAESASLFDDNSLFFVFIDAAHDYDNVRRDVEAWLPKLKTGGWIAGHDVNMEKFPGVYNAVKDVCDAHGLQFHVRGEIARNRYPCWEIRL